jgi:hypothetical protein
LFFQGGKSIILLQINCLKMKNLIVKLKIINIMQSELRLQGVNV